MTNLVRTSTLSLAFLLGGIGCCGARETLPGGGAANPSLEIRSLSVNGQPIPLRPDQKLRLSAMAKNVTFAFGAVTNSPRAPLRLRYRLDGFEDTWHENVSDLSISFRFIDANQDPVSEKAFPAAGQTEGWTGALETSSFRHRRETVVVPPGARGLWVSVSSAGPPATVGVYAITNLAVTRLPTNGQPAAVLVSWNSDAKGEVVDSDWLPTDWTRSGLRTSMAKITQFGPNQRIKALTLVDNDPNAHAEWTTHKENAAPVQPGDRLLLEWDEAFSLGLAGPGQAVYAALPAGFYRLRVNELSLAGLPGEAESSLTFEVPQPFWRAPWFWALAMLLCLSGAAGTYRYVISLRVRRELARLQSQRALEHERLRIARDIHDDLGARVTQISLVSGLAQGDPALSEKARADFSAISGMARELVSALYETVWAVNPENDNLDELGNYVCQMVDNLCDKAQLAHRLHVAELPRDVQVPSHVRHNLILAVKEAVHNVIKHARATELVVRVDWEGGMLSIRIQDNGRGFEATTTAPGNGLANMQRRLEQAGGTCSFQSEPGRGTAVLLRAQISSPS